MATRGSDGTERAEGVSVSERIVAVERLAVRTRTRPRTGLQSSTIARSTGSTRPRARSRRAATSPAFARTNTACVPARFRGEAGSWISGSAAHHQRALAAQQGDDFGLDRSALNPSPHRRNRGRWPFGPEPARERVQQVLAPVRLERRGRRVSPRSTTTAPPRSHTEIDGQRHARLEARTPPECSSARRASLEVRQASRSRPPEADRTVGGRAGPRARLHAQGNRSRSIAIDGPTFVDDREAGRRVHVQAIGGSIHTATACSASVATSARDSRSAPERISSSRAAPAASILADGRARPRQLAAVAGARSGARSRCPR